MLKKYYDNEVEQHMPWLSPDKEHHRGLRGGLGVAAVDGDEQQGVRRQIIVDENETWDLSWINIQQLKLT